MPGQFFYRLYFAANKFGKLYLFSGSIFFVSGIVFPRFSQTAVCIFFLMFLLFFVLRRKFLLLLSLYILAFIFGAQRIEHYRNLYENSDIKNMWGKQVEITGTIISEANIKGATTEYVFVPANADVGRKKDPFGNIILKLPRYPEYFYGDKLKVTGLIEEPGEFQDFSYKEYLKTQGIAGTSKPFVNKIDEKGNPVLKQISRLKSKLRLRMKSALGEPHATLALGILIGLRNGMPSEFADALSKTGTTHIVAASGYNVSVVLASLAPLQGILGRKRLFYISLFLLTLFALVVGLDNIPALRAAVMGYVYLFAKQVGRKGHIVTILTFTAALFAFLNPFVLNSLSFQLSFLSTYGLIVLSEKVEKLLSSIPLFLRQELTPTISATAATTPVILLNFGKLSTLSLLVNVLVLPVIPWIMFLGALQSFLLLLNAKLGTLFSIAVYFPLEYMIEVILWFGRLDFASVDLQWDIRLTILAYGLIGLIFLESDFKKYRKRYGKN